MGLFGPSDFEQAVHRQMDRYSAGLWGCPIDTEDALALKEAKLNELRAKFDKIEDRKLRKARLNWISNGFESIAYRRQQRGIEAINLPPL